MRSFEDPEPGVTDVHPVPTAPKKFTGKNNAFIPSNCPHSFDDPEPGVPEANPVPTAPKKLTGKKKAFIPSNRPRNKAESASITAGSPHTASATKASSVRVKHVKTSTHGKCNKNDEGGARHAWVSSMLLNGNRKEAFGAMMKANPTASIPRMTLNNALIAAKRKVNENTSAGDCMEYGIGRIKVKL